MVPHLKEPGPIISPTLTGATTLVAHPTLDVAVGTIDRITFWILCVGAFGLPLVYLRDTHDEFVLPKLLSAHLLVVSLLALHAARWAAAGALVIRRTPLDLPILAFLASALVSTIFSISQNVALFGTYGRYEGLLTLGTYAALFWLAAQTVRGRDRARTLIRVMLAGAYLVSIIAIVQWVIAALTTTAPSADTGFSFAGLPRASATLSNPTMLGTFLALLLPVGAMEFLEARSLTNRVLAANVVFTMSLALALTFVRMAWLGALAGLVIAVAAPQRTRLRVRLAMSGAVVVVLVIAALATGAIARGGLPLISSVLERAASIGVLEGSGLTRIHVWKDTVPLIASRPVTGYGPDTFGIVYPRFRTGDWAPGYTIDKAPSEVLQIAATQGLLGVASYLWILAASAVAFWHGRRNPGAAAAFAGLVAYQLWAQVNFSWVPAALPYWLFLAAAVCIWAAELPEVRVGRLPRLRAMAVAVPVGLALIGLSVISGGRGWSADRDFQAGLGAESRGDLSSARASLAAARALAPEQSQYALEAGRVDLLSNGLGDARWHMANEAFSDAARLGTYYSAVYYDLALTDIQLGRRADAIAALHKALELNPGDPASLALLRQLTGA